VLPPTGTGRNSADHPVPDSATAPTLLCNGIPPKEPTSSGPRKSPGFSVSSPVIWGDRIYLTTAISSDAKQTFRTGLYGDTDSAPDRSPHQWKVLALDKKTGKLLWEQTAYQGTPKTKRHPKSSQASPTPVTDGKVVVAYFGSEGLVTYSTDGKLLWKKDLDCKTPDGSSTRIRNGARPALR
jgi:outer membrane protein assembly factor BamB